MALFFGETEAGNHHKTATNGFAGIVASTLLEVIQIELTLEQLNDYSVRSLAQSTTESL
jgi:hypothetical protein